MKYKAILHEMDSANRHRIVAVTEDNLTEVGEWVSADAVATFGVYFASMKFDGPLPVGVFTVKEVYVGILNDKPARSG